MKILSMLAVASDAGTGESTLDLHLFTVSPENGKSGMLNRLSLTAAEPISSCEEPLRDKYDDLTFRGADIDLRDVRACCVLT